MSALDVLVVSVLGGVAAYPALFRWAAYAADLLRKRPSPAPTPSPAGETVDGWRQRWVNTLIGLLGELESRPDGRPSEPAETLCRQLTWEIIGGQPDKQVKK